MLWLNQIIQLSYFISVHICTIRSLSLFTFIIFQFIQHNNLLVIKIHVNLIMGLRDSLKLVT